MARWWEDDIVVYGSIDHYPLPAPVSCHGESGRKRYYGVVLWPVRSRCARSRVFSFLKEERQKAYLNSLIEKEFRTRS
jgi:hypothetical protein